MEQYFRVGVFANTHGIRGEIKVYPTTDDVSRFRDTEGSYPGYEEGAHSVGSGRGKVL